MDRAIEPSAAGPGIIAFRGRPSQAQRLVIRDRSGKELGAAGAPLSAASNVTLSPDGRRIAIQSNEQGSDDIWIHEVDRAIKTRLTPANEGERRPVWSPDGKSAAYVTGGKVHIVSSDGTGKPAVVDSPFNAGFVHDWSPDGGTISAMTILGTNASNDTFFLRKNGGKWESHPFLAGPFDEGFAKFSRDGKFVAYVSNESGAYEIMVRPFPSGPGKWRISTNGGVQPRWSRNGKEIYYLEDGVLMGAPISIRGSEIVPGAPKKLFDTGAFHAGRLVSKYDEFPDGRFLVMERAPDPDDDSGNIHVIQGWTALMGRK